MREQQLVPAGGARGTRSHRIGHLAPVLGEGGGAPWAPSIRGLAALSEDLFGRAQEARSFPDCFGLGQQASAGTIAQLAEFIALDRLCVGLGRLSPYGTGSLIVPDLQGRFDKDVIEGLRTGLPELQNRCGGESSQAGSIPVRLRYA